MKRKMICAGLLLSLFVFAAGCSSKTEKESKTTPEVQVTVVPSNSPLPTACVEVVENKGNTSTLTNETDGYQLDYDSNVLEMKNESSTLSFKATEKNKKAQEELNLFLSITTTDSKTATALGKQLKSAYKKSIKKKSVKLGKGKNDAILYTISKVDKLHHEIYIITSDDKGWYIELKCPAKYEKKYLTAFEDILGSMDFSATVKE